MRLANKIIVIILALLFVVPVYADWLEDFEDTNYNMAESGRCEAQDANGCAPGERFNEGGDRGYVWQVTFEDGSGGDQYGSMPSCSTSSQCCQDTYFGHNTSGTGADVWVNFFFKYGTAANPHTWGASICGTGRSYELKWPDIAGGAGCDDRIIVKHNVGSSYSYGGIVIYIQPPGGGGYEFPPKTSGQRSSIISAGITIVAEDADGLYNDIASNTWKQFQFYLNENGSNDELIIWEDGADENSPTFHYRGDLYTASAHTCWANSWSWGYRNQGEDSDEVVFYDDVQVSTAGFIDGEGGSETPHFSGMGGAGMRHN